MSAPLPPLPAPVPIGPGVPSPPPYGPVPPFPSPPFPINPSRFYGGYPPCNPSSAWFYAPPPTGCVYGLDGTTQSWVPVVTLWQLLCVVQQAVQQYAVVPEAPADGNDYVRNGLQHAWVNVQDLDLDGGTYP
jgi:hypothetical protein